MKVYKHNAHTQLYYEESPVACPPEWNGWQWTTVAMGTGRHLVTCWWPRSARKLWDWGPRTSEVSMATRIDKSGCAPGSCGTGNHVHKRSQWPPG